MTATGEWFPVSGGSNTTVDGEIILCSRNDADPQRKFSGSIAHVELRSEGLTPKQVSAIYNTYAAGLPALQELATQQEPEIAVLPPCAFPFSLNGTAHSTCIPIHSTRVCKDAAKAWQFCDGSVDSPAGPRIPDLVCKFPLRWQVRCCHHLLCMYVRT